MSKVVEEKDVANPRIATLMRPRFDHIPPTLLIVAECDPLRDDSYGAYQRLSSMRHCIDKDQLSLTNSRDALHHGERAANKSDGRLVW